MKKYLWHAVLILFFIFLSFFIFLEERGMLIGLCAGTFCASIYLFIRTIKSDKSKTDLVIETILIASSILIATWYLLLGPCGKLSVDRSLKLSQSILAEFADADNIAMSTSRITLTVPVSNLQDIAQRFDQVDMPECLLYFKTSMSLSFSETIDGYLSFMAEDDNNIVSAHMDNAKSLLDTALSAANSIKNCYPLCQ